MDKITTHIDKLKAKKAAGIDGIPSQCITFARDKLAGPLPGVLNLLFTKGDWPDIWSEGLINPVHKGSRNGEDKYRKITFIPTLGKVLESILNSRLTYRKILIDDTSQFGFKDNARTIDKGKLINITMSMFDKAKMYSCPLSFR